MKSLAAATLGLLVAATSATETQTTSASDSTNKSLKFDLERVHLKGNETIDDPAEDI